MNQTFVAEFILLGLTKEPKLQSALFFLFFLIYTFTVVCNTGISILIIMVSQLHKPMYFFICNLSISDFWCSSVIAPKMLSDLLSEKKSITFYGCEAQAFFFIMFASFGAYMLSAMAYDQYAAICHPLHYSFIMSWSVCILLVTGVYLSGVITSGALTICAFHASFRGSVINHFYCDAPTVMAITSSERFNEEMGFLAICYLFGLGSLSITVTSYVYIVSAILKIPSTAGRRKTFSTCGSHLTCLSVFYVTGFFNYLSLPGSGSNTLNKALSVGYTVLIPMLNPLIYSLRNQELKSVSWAIMHKYCFCNKMYN